MYKLLIPLFVLALLAGCTSDTTPVMTDPTPDPVVSDGQHTPPAFDGTLLQGTHVVIMQTSQGDIVLEIDANAAPKTATNFIRLAQAGYYDGLTFHRVIPDFMIQGGDPNGNGTGGSSIYGDTFEDEQNSLPMDRGAIAMANRGPNTNGSQFFIVQAESTPWLQGKHTIFGRVTQGMDVVDAISMVPTNDFDMPLDPVVYTMRVR